MTPDETKEQPPLSQDPDINPLAGAVPPEEETNETPAPVAPPVRPRERTAGEASDGK